MCKAAWYANLYSHLEFSHKDMQGIWSLSCIFEELSQLCCGTTRYILSRKQEQVARLGNFASYPVLAPGYARILFRIDYSSVFPFANIVGNYSPRTTTRAPLLIGSLPGPAVWYTVLNFSIEQIKQRQIKVNPLRVTEEEHSKKTHGVTWATRSSGNLSGTMVNKYVNH